MLTQAGHGYKARLSQRLRTKFHHWAVQELLPLWDLSTTDSQLISTKCRGACCISVSKRKLQLNNWLLCDLAAVSASGKPTQDTAPTKKPETKKICVL